jgi:hypothetical protein
MGGALIHGNTISFTVNDGSLTGPFPCDNPDGSGIYFERAGSYDLVISNNTIENNSAFCNGGGIQLNGPPNATIRNNIIRNNQGYGEGGGIWASGGQGLSILQNLIYGNVAGEAGGGMYVAGGSEGDGTTGPIDLFITSNTIVGNKVVPNPELIDDYDNGSQIAFRGYLAQTGLFNNIILASDDYAAVSCDPRSRTGGAPVVVGSDVFNSVGPEFGGWCTNPSGFGNISVDPKFEDRANNNYHLSPGSPAIDSGYNAALGILSQDLDGNPRVQNASGLAQAITDMGAYEAAGTPNLRTPSQIALSSPNTSVSYGQTVNLQAAVTASSPVTSGTVSFLDDWSGIGQSGVDSNGTASFSTSGLLVGTHWIVASFGGNATFDESASTAVSIVVQGFLTRTTMTFSSQSVYYSEPVTINVAVTSSSGTPAGYVYLTNSTGLLATMPVSASGTASFTTSSLPVGTYYVQALYEGLGGFLGSESGEVPLQILAAPATTTLTSSQNPAGPGAGLSFTATVSASGSTTPTGTVTFTTGTATLGTATLVAGVAMLANVPATASSGLGSGVDLVTANYSGDAHFPASSGTLEQVVSNSPGPMLLSISQAAVQASAGGFYLTVNGVNFTTGSVVLWNGLALPTTYVSSLQLRAFIGSQNILVAGTNLVTVANRAPNAWTTAAMPFAVLNARPVVTISGASISDATDENGNYVLSLAGTDFVSDTVRSGSTVLWNGENLPTFYVSPWQVWAVVTPAQLAARPATISVANPDGTSGDFGLP